MPINQSRIALCSGAYTADRAGRMVIITARGTHTTSGYRVDFEQTGERPLELRFVHIAPAGPSVDRITPFGRAELFNDDESEVVLIEDATGEHRIKIRDASGAVSRIFPAKMSEANQPCKPCVRDAIEAWSRSEVIDWSATLADIYRPKNGACDPDAISDLVARLNAERCGRQIGLDDISCGTTAEGVLNAVC